MRYVIMYTDGSTDLVECEDYIEVKFGKYVDIDGELYGNSGPVDVEWVSTARSCRPESEQEVPVNA